MRKKRKNSQEEKAGYYVKVREAFDQIRHQKREGFSLKWRLFIVVAVGLAVGIWTGYAVAEVLRIMGVELDNINLLIEVSLVSLIVALGFSQSEATGAVSKLDQTLSTDELIKGGLKNLSR